MKKIIRILEEQGVDDSMIRLAPFALAKCRKDSYDHLNLLCGGQKKLMAGVTVGVIVLWLIKKFNERCRKDLKSKKTEARVSARELNQYLDAIQLVARLDHSIDQQALRAKAVYSLTERRKRNQTLSSDRYESKLEYQKMLGQIIAAARVGTNQSDNAIHDSLAKFLNSIGCTTLESKKFSRLNINK
jgi:hypothetical protein